MSHLIYYCFIYSYYICFIVRHRILILYRVAWPFLVGFS